MAGLRGGARCADPPRSLEDDRRSRTLPLDDDRRSRPLPLPRRGDDARRRRGLPALEAFHPRRRSTAS